MEITPEEKQKLKAEIKEEYILRVKKMVLERVLKDNEERLSKYAAEISGAMVEDLRKEFPL